MQRLKDSSASRRLSLIYLANEVAQQSRIRQKEDFIIAFSPVIAEAVSTAYKGSPVELQGKLKRVLDVWRDRVIFEKPIQQAIDSRLSGKFCTRNPLRPLTDSPTELDKAKGTAKPGFSSSPFGGAASVPPEFTPLVTAHQAVSKLSFPLKSTVTSAAQEYEKHTDPSTPVPSAPVYAARLNGLLKTLATAESAVAECVKAREGLISGLEKLLEANRAALEKDKEAVSKLTAQKTEIEDKKQQVEVAIMQALGSTENNGPSGEGNSHSPSVEPDRPEMEALTPEPVDDYEPCPPQSTVIPQEANKQEAASGIEVLSNLASSYQSLPISNQGSNKRRRVDDSDDFPDLGGDDGIDADVAEMLKDGSS